MVKNTKSLTIGWVLALGICVFLTQSAAGQTIIVDANATPGGDGLTWGTAHKYLQDALADAEYGDEIWVAEGIYLPDQGNGITPGDRTATFQLLNSVAIYGGFPPGGGNWEERDPKTNVTILSGDLAGDDVGDFSHPSRLENSEHVVTGSSTDGTAILDGFTVRDGYADGLTPNTRGGGMYNYQGSPTLVNCTFTKNISTLHAAVMYNLRSSPTIINCTFIRNTASSYCGGIYNFLNSHPSLVDCRFEKNMGFSGGAMRNVASSHPAIVNCIFVNNYASLEGGAIDNHDVTGHSNPTITNSIFVGNDAGSNGGAIRNYNSHPTLVNCTFISNSAGSMGGGIFNSGAETGSNPTVTNCILWNNSDGTGTTAVAQIFTFSGDPNVNYNCVQGGFTGGVGNIDTNPLFVRDPFDGGNGWGDDNDDFGDLHLICGSPCLDAGDNNALLEDITDLDNDGNTAEPIPLDLGGDPRVVHDNVDMGAYEGPNQAFIIVGDPVTVLEGTTATFTVALACEPQGIVNVNVVRIDGDEDIDVNAGSTLVFDDSNYSSPQTVELAAAEDPDFTNGTATIQVCAIGISDAYTRADEVDNDLPPNQPVIYVDESSVGDNNGTSWTDAFTDLQLALYSASQAGSVIAEIWVASGTYTPAPPGGDRENTFQLLNGVAIYGGFPSSGDPNWSDRDSNLYETILSGDLNGDDYLDANNSENSYHVVTNNATIAAPVLDGFVITGGNANGAASGGYDDGGGLHSISNSAATPRIANCLFRNNSAMGFGGGIYNQTSNSGNNFELANCIFRKNFARYGGGVCLSSNSVGDSVTIANCMLEGNRAAHGGGLDLISGTVHVSNCLFIDNIAEYCGGGLDSSWGTVELSNCTFLRNSTWGTGLFFGGGGIASDSWSMSIDNCLFWGNSALQGPEIGIVGIDAVADITYSNIKESQKGVYVYSSSTLNWGEGNIDVQPNLTPNGHLISGSACIDAGDSNAVPPDRADLDGDGNTVEPLPFDIDGDPRFVDDANIPDTGNGPFPIVDMGADEFLDSDRDRLPNFWEQKYFGDPNIAEPNGDPDGDWLTNLEEYELYSSDPNASPYHVDTTDGNDAYNGLAATPQGGNVGPKKTIQAGIDAAGDGDTVLVAAGTYTGPNNIDLDFGGKKIVLYAPDGPNNTIIDCNDTDRGFHFHSGESAGTAVVGFTITNGNADFGGAILCKQSHPQIRDCIITGNTATEQGGGLYCYLSTPTLADCNIIDNSPNGILMEYGGARIEGRVELSGNDWVGSDIMLYGDGVIQMDSSVTLDLTDARIRCDISGPGTIRVDLDSELIIEKNAFINLGHETDPNLDGQIICNGLLRLRDYATVINAQVHVSRASVEDNAIILNSVITAEAGAPYGQFFIEDNVQIWLDRIIADGDRYLDLDPTDFDVNNIHIDVIDVNITEGVGGTRGGLFELRGKPDLVSGTCDPNNEFFCQVIEPETIPPFDPNNWTINRLELVEDAKLNLTNRFDFQAPYDFGGDDEALYVKHLVLRANSILNTAFQQIYYETLDRDPTARVVNIPLLGFSLVNISFNDEIDYLTRVKHNNFEHPTYDRIHVRRMVGQEPDANGLMQMCTLKDLDPQSPSYNRVINARAKGTFAKAAEENITIEFEYMFVEDPYNEAEIVVYLSDEPQVGDNLVEVARIRPPAPGSPGSIGSGTFAVFSGTFSRGALNFNRGTYVELELRGREGTCCWINNWDPMVYCLTICGDYDLDYHVLLYDYLVLLAEFGLTGPSGVGKGCLDLVPDGCIGPDDLIAWDISKVLNKCGLEGGFSASSETLVGEKLTLSQQLGVQSIGKSELFICGKPSGIIGGDVPNNYLYDVDSSGVSTGDVNETENDGRLITDSDGTIYQISGSLGLVCLDTATTVVEPSIIDDGNNLVWIGVNGAEGLWLRDAAFKPGDPNIVYVVPVMVDPQDGNCPYMATAKLQLTGNGNYDLLKLYGKDPAEESTRLPTDCSNIWNFLYDPDVYHLREVEVDSSGNHLFVLSSKLYSDPNGTNINKENNWVLIYNEVTGNSSEVRVNISDHDVIGPTAMVVSSLEEKVYLASSAHGLNEPNDLMTEVYCFSIDNVGQTVVGLSYEHRLDINCPSPDICIDYLLLCDVELGFISTIVSMTENSDDGTLYVTGFTAPKFADDASLPFDKYAAEIFTTPILAAFSPEASEPVEAVIITDCDLALPLSLVWTGDKCAGADINGNGVVNFPDFAILALQWLQAPGTPSADIVPEPDGNDIVNFLDLAAVANHWLETGCD